VTGDEKRRDDVEAAAGCGTTVGVDRDGYVGASGVADRRTLCDTRAERRRCVSGEHHSRAVAPEAVGEPVGDVGGERRFGVAVMRRAER
jgi:hypothetical protein